MSLVHSPLTRTAPLASGIAGATARAMEYGQHLIALVLTAIGVVRAVGDGTGLPLAIGCGVAILVWHTAGTILPMRGGTRRLVVWWLVGFALLWGAAVAVSAEFVWLSFLLWLLAGHLLPLVWGAAFSVVVLAAAIAAPILHHGSTSYADIVGPLLGGIFAFGISRGYLQLLKDAAERERLVSSLRRAQAEMSELQDELAIAQRLSGAIAERTRISRDIHDTVAQALSSIRLLAHAGSGRATDPESARTLAHVEALSGDSLADVRRIVAALAPAELEDDALAAALRRMLDRLRAETGMQAELHVDESLPTLPTEIEVALLRTAQSAIANVRMHAGAARLVASLTDAGETVRLDVTDDGSGFDTTAWEAAPQASASSFGLRFMRSRLRELGGGLDIESAPGEGTALSAYLPLHGRPARQDPAETS